MISQGLRQGGFSFDKTFLEILVSRPTEDYNFRDHNSMSFISDFLDSSVC